MNLEVQVILKSIAILNYVMCFLLYVKIETKELHLNISLSPSQVHWEESPAHCVDSWRVSSICSFDVCLSEFNPSHLNIWSMAAVDPLLYRS